jgi:hypothetical protein
LASHHLLVGDAAAAAAAAAITGGQPEKPGGHGSYSLTHTGGRETHLGFQDVNPVLAGQSDTTAALHSCALDQANGPKTQDNRDGTDFRDQLQVGSVSLFCSQKCLFLLYVYCPPLPSTYEEPLLYMESSIPGTCFGTPAAAVLGLQIEICKYFSTGFLHRCDLV